MCFVDKLIFCPTVENCENWLRFDKVIAEIRHNTPCRIMLLLNNFRHIWDRYTVKPVVKWSDIIHHAIWIPWLSSADRHTHHTSDGQISNQIILIRFYFRSSKSSAWENRTTRFCEKQCENYTKRRQLLYFVSFLEFSFSDKHLAVRVGYRTPHSTPISPYYWYLWFVQITHQIMINSNQFKYVLPNKTL